MQLYDPRQNRWIHHRHTAEYRQRKLQLRDYWIIGLLLSLTLPPGLQLAAIAFAGFLSLSYLDELPYRTLDD